MIAAVLTPVALNLGSALVQSSRPTGARCSLGMSDLADMSGLNPSSATDRAAVAARAAAARYPTQPIYGSPGSGGAVTDAEAKLKWAADRDAQQRTAQRSESPPPPSDATVRLAKATEHLRREYSSTAASGAGTIYTPPGSGGGMTDAQAKQLWSAQRSASQRAAARQMAAAAPTTAAPDAGEATLDAGEATLDDEPAAAEPVAAEPTAPAAAAPANTASYPQPTTTASTSLAATARARPSLYPTQSIYAPPGAGGPMTDAEAKRKYMSQRNAEQRWAERAARAAGRPTTQ